MSYEIKRKAISEITRLKQWFRDNEDAYFDGDIDVIKQWAENEDKIEDFKNVIRNHPNRKNEQEPVGLYDSYDSPYDVPNEVYKWIYNHSNILTSDATDAVRWSRIVDTQSDSRYPSGDVDIYRAVENNLYNEIRPGDWVTLDIKYANKHNEMYFDGNGYILKETVDGRDVLRSPTGDAEEAIYAPIEYSVPLDNILTESLSNDKFKQFINNFKQYDKYLIEAVETGYQLLFENSKVIANEPTTDGYMQLIVDESEIGYLITAPANEEYPSMFLPFNALALVEIKIYQEYRNKGYARQTIKWLEQYAQQNGYDSLFLRVDDDSDIDVDDLVKVYSHVGFIMYNHHEEDDTYMYKML